MLSFFQFSIYLSIYLPQNTLPPPKTCVWTHVCVDTNGASSYTVAASVNWRSWRA